MAAAVIQARMCSTRFPGKVLKPLPNGRTVLGTVMQACANAETITDVIVATSTNRADSEIVREVLIAGADIWIGEEDDVLKRMYDAAYANTRADVIVRVTSDCPMLSPLTIDQCVRRHGKHKVDFTYNSNSEMGDGQDVEVINMSVLEEANELAKLKYDREHVTSYIRRNPKYKKLFVHPPDGDYRSLNTIEDYEWICKEMIK